MAYVSRRAALTVVFGNGGGTGEPARGCRECHRPRDLSELLFDGTDEAIWTEYIGGKFPVTAHWIMMRLQGIAS